MDKQDIFELALYKNENEFVKKALTSESEVMVDIVQVLSDFPYIGSLVKLGMIGCKYMELRFIKKLAKFLESDLSIPYNEKERFVNSLKDSDRKKIQDYVVQYLLHAEDDEKAVLMGYLYKSCVLNKIDKVMFLRLCSIIDRAFVDDLHQLKDYINENEEYSVIANNFINLGLIDNYTGGFWKDKPTYQLNEVSKKLYEILNENNWC